MSKINHRFRHGSLLIVSVGLAAASAHADVVIEQTLDLDGVAGFSMLAMQGTSITSLTPDKSRVDSDMKFKSALVNRFAGKYGNSSQIVRLDKGLVYDLQHKDKQYTEMSFAEMRASMDKAMQQMEATAEQQPQSLPVDADECQWSAPVVDAKETGERATIAGVETRRAIVSLKQTCTDPKTQKACDMVWTVDQWLASQVPGEDESKAFALNYAKQLGFDSASVQAMQGRMQQAFGEYKDSWTEAMKKASEFQGYPLKSALQMSMGGPQCTTESGTQVAADPMFADAVDAGIQAGASTAAGQAASVATQAAVEKAGGGVGGAIAGSAAGAFASKMGSSLMNKFKKKEQPAPAPAATDAATAAPSMIRLFRMQSETTAIRTADVPNSTFELPAEYRRAATPK
jgi:hypothetical protein